MGRIVNLTDRDKDTVLNIVRQTYGEDTARQQDTLWQWRIEDNPWFAPDYTYRLGFESEGEVKGTIAIFPTKMKIGEQILSGICPHDLVVLPTVDRRNLTSGALMIAREVASRSTPVIYGNTDDRTYKLWGRVFGCEGIIGRYHCYYREIDFAPWLRRHGVPGWVAAICGVAYDVASALNRLVMAIRMPRDVEIRRIQQFDAEFDALWQSASAGYPNMLVRDHEFLQWRFKRVPERDYVAFGAYRAGKLVGYTVVRRMDEGGYISARIVDVFAHRQDIEAFRRLIGAAIAEGRRMKATRVSMIEMYQPEFRREMAWAMFMRGKWTVNISGRCRGCPSEAFYDASKWWITFADADLDLVA